MHLRGADLSRPAAPNNPNITIGKKPKWVWEFNDTQTGMPLGIPRGARCVQRFDDSLNSAIHITYRISLRSSSMREPRDPLLKVVLFNNKNVLLWHYVVCVKEDRRGPLKCTGEVEVDARRAHAPVTEASKQPRNDSLMILPQVHLRKPCYDFYFL